MLTVAPVPDPAAVVLLPDAGWIELLAFALLAALLWAVVERHRHQVEARDRERWEIGYWHVLATATCPLCGSRMEPDHSLTPMHEAHRGDLT